MKIEMKKVIIYKIIDRNTGGVQSSYQRSYWEQSEFSSIYEARHTNCHDVFLDKEKYKINKYKITCELIEEDVDK